MLKTFTRRRTALVCLAGALLAPMSLTAMAEDAFPTRPITLVVPFAAGGGSDILARIVASGMADRLKQPVVIDNRPGDSANIAADKVTKSKPDGYTMLLGNTNVFVVNSLLNKNMTYNAARDLSLVGMVADFPMVLVVTPLSKANTVADFVAQAKAAPGQMTYASPGTGSPHHLAMEMLKHRAGIQAVHAAYRGVSPAFPDLISGRVQAMFVDYAAGASLIKDGKLKPLAVASFKPSALVPTLPTMIQSGFPGFELTGWQGIAVPAGVPDAVTKKLTDALRQTIADPAVRDRLIQAGLEPNFLDPAAFGSHIAKEKVTMEALVKSNNIRID